MGTSFTARGVHSTACDTGKCNSSKGSMGAICPAIKKARLVQMEKPGSQVGATRFERATSCSQSRRSSQAELRPDSHRRDAYTCEQVCWERRLSDLFDNRRTRRVANKTRSRKVHSAVFFRGRQERPKSRSHGPKVRSEIALFPFKTPYFATTKPQSCEGTVLLAPEITGNPQVHASDRADLHSRHTPTPQLRPAKKTIDAMSPKIGAPLLA